MPTQLEGDFRELYAKLGALSSRLNVRVIRSALRRATRQTLNKIRSQAPQGNHAHRTYRRRLVSPGFLKRSLRIITKVDAQQGRVSSIIGVRKEAFYGPQFYDQGPYTITSRRVDSGGRAFRQSYYRATKNGKVRLVKQTELRSRGLRLRSIKPYTLRKQPFFQSTFISNRAQMESDFTDYMRQEIDKAVKNGR